MSNSEVRIQNSEAFIEGRYSGDFSEGRYSGAFSEGRRRSSCREVGRRGTWAAIRWSVAAILVVMFTAVSAIAQTPAVVAPEPGGEILIDRTLAVVGGQVIALSDVRTLLALGLVEGATDADPVAAATEHLIDRLLMLQEVERYAPPEPSAETIAARLAVVGDRFDTPEAFATVLREGGMTEARLRAWVRDDYRIIGYLDQRFAAAGAPSNEEVVDYFNAHRAEFEQGGLTFEQAEGQIRQGLTGARRRDLIADWVSGLRRRAEIVRPENGSSPQGL